MDSFVDRALALARIGFEVFPLGERAKVPLIAGGAGFKDATCSEARIAAWWARAPMANIGIATGGHFFVLDIDLKETTDPTTGELTVTDGWATLSALEAKYGRLPDTKTARSGSGKGEHRYFTAPVLPQSGTHRAGTGLDIKADGGYVVAPPSIHDVSGLEYVWLKDGAMVPAPAWLLAVCRPDPAPAPIPSSLPVPSVDLATKLKRGRAALRKMSVAVEGQRGHSSLLVACKIGPKLSIPREYWEPVVRSEYLPVCVPPFTEAHEGQVRHKFDEAYGPALRPGEEGAMLREQRGAPPRSPAAPMASAPHQLAPPEPVKRIYSIAELREKNEKPISCLAPYVVEGGITQIVGDPKLAGKTTFAMWMANSIIHGAPFLNEPTTKSNVVFMSEMRTGFVLDFVDGIDPEHGMPGLFVFPYHESLDLAWPERVGKAVTFAVENKAGLLLIDTFSQWSDIQGEQENQAGSMQEALKPLALATSAGISVILIRHTKKSGGSLATSARGSSAITGSVDVILEIKAGTTANERVLHSEGRLSDRFPKELLVELREGGYAVAGEDPMATRKRFNDLKVLGVLTEPLTVESILERLRQAGSGIKRTSLFASLQRLAVSRSISVSGKGVKGDPTVYAKWGPLRGSGNGIDEDKENHTVDVDYSVPGGAGPNGNGNGIDEKYSSHSHSVPTAGNGNNISNTNHLINVVPTFSESPRARVIRMPGTCCSQCSQWLPVDDAQAGNQRCSDHPPAAKH